MVDLTEAIKIKIIERMASSSEVTALVPATSIYPMQVSDDPRKPFIRCGIPSTAPYEDNCGKGSEVLFPIQVFSMSESTTQRIAAVLVEQVPLGLEVLDCEWQRTQIMREPGEADAWAATVTFLVIDRE